MILYIIFTEVTFASKKMSLRWKTCYKYMMRHMSLCNKINMIWLFIILINLYSLRPGIKFITIFLKLVTNQHLESVFIYRLQRATHSHKNTNICWYKLSSLFKLLTSEENSGNTNIEMLKFSTVENGTVAWKRY